MLPRSSDMGLDASEGEEAARRLLVYRGAHRPIVLSSDPQPSGWRDQMTAFIGQARVHDAARRGGGYVAARARAQQVVACRAWGYWVVYFVRTLVISRKSSSA